MKHSAELLQKIKSSDNFGIDLQGKATANLEKIMQRKKSVVEMQRKGIGSLLDNNKINFIKGDAYITKHGSLEVDEKENMVIFGICNSKKSDVVLRYSVMRLFVNRLYSNGFVLLC